MSREGWLDVDGWACIPGCPDDVCRSMGTCAYNDPDSIAKAAEAGPS